MRICLYTLITVFLCSAPSLIPLAHAQVYEEPYEIRSIYFGGGSYFIDNKQKSEILNWLDSFPNLNEYEIKIHGHTDNIGSIEYNRRLSKMRSGAVFRMIVDHDIPEEWIQIKSFGEENPVFDNSDWNGKLNNRRVDVILVPPST